jgi:hypothetical protein
MRSESTTINEGGAFQAPGFKTAWTFSREGGEPIPIEGEITVRQDRSEVPDAGEQFAREVATALGWL